jgi:hypothetical protein
MMRRFARWALAAGLAIIVAPVALLLPERQAPAADHLEPALRADPAFDTTPDRAADIADIYAWHTATSLIVVVTFAGPQSITLPAVYDRDVLYGVHIGTGVPKSDATMNIYFRFGADTANGSARHGIEVTGLPGVNGTLVGPVETSLAKDGVRVRAGLFDDPFFFDSAGLRMSRSSGSLMFDRNRNFFGGQNLTAVVMEIPRDRISSGTNPVGVWSTAARIGGQI